MPKKARSRPEVKYNSFVLWIESHVGEKHGVFKKDVAKKIGLTPGAFSIRMKNGKFDYAEMVKIFDFFRATDDEILSIMKGKGVNL